jgi:hypothetical protein
MMQLGHAPKRNEAQCQTQSEHRHHYLAREHDRIPSVGKSPILDAKSNRGVSEKTVQSRRGLTWIAGLHRAPCIAHLPGVGEPGCAANRTCTRRNELFSRTRLRDHNNGQILGSVFIQDSRGMSKAGALKRVGRVGRADARGTLGQIPREKRPGRQSLIYGTLGVRILNRGLSGQEFGREKVSKKYRLRPPKCRAQTDSGVVAAHRGRAAYGTAR